MLTVNDFPPFKDWFFEKFSEWERLQPRKRSSYTEFSDYLSQNSFGLKIRQQYVSRWVQGSEPSEKYIPAIAEMLGEEVYKIIGYERPNPYLQKINQLFENLSPEHQQKLVQDAERYEEKNHANAKAIHHKRKSA